MELAVALATMPVSALLVTLSPQPEASIQATTQLQQNPQLTLGDANGHLLPVVVESETIRDARNTAERIEQTPGVVQVELVSLDFSDLNEAETQPASTPNGPNT